MNTTDIGICTWSVGNDIDRIRNVLTQGGVTRLHLDVSAAARFQDTVANEAWTVSGMMLSFPQEDYSTLERIRKTGGIVPDAHWQHNRLLALDAIQTTAIWRVPFLSFHAGFIDAAHPSTYDCFCSRLTELADASRSAGVKLILETGQETATELKQLLEHLNHPALGVNFDPANMLLYGKGDPIAALEVLAPWVVHVHLKDALPSTDSTQWGIEVPWGEGAVGVQRFFEQLQSIGYAGYAAVEREAGSQREADMLSALQQTRNHLKSVP
ncbi:MAG: sugar phosphate isomerase/epimerase family protein [Puniceicoccaceae bacterium]